LEGLGEERADVTRPAGDDDLQRQPPRFENANPFATTTFVERGERNSSGGSMKRGFASGISGLP
jgi:hypothetical protein